MVEERGASDGKWMVLSGAACGGGAGDGAVVGCRWWVRGLCYPGAFSLCFLLF